MSMELVEAGAWEKAEPMVRECLDIRAKAEPNAWTTFNPDFRGRENNQLSDDCQGQR
jgi:hypothetical protein